MNEEKKAQMRTKSQNKKIGDSIRKVNIFSLVVISIGFLIFILNINETTNKIGQGLIIGCMFLIILTIFYQMIASSKMKKMK